MACRQHQASLFPFPNGVRENATHGSTIGWLFTGFRRVTKRPGQFLPVGFKSLDKLLAQAGLQVVIMCGCIVVERLRFEFFDGGLFCRQQLVSGLDHLLPCRRFLVNGGGLWLQMILMNQFNASKRNLTIRKQDSSIGQQSPQRPSR